jgi:hypothetical protein
VPRLLRPPSVRALTLNLCDGRIGRQKLLQYRRLRQLELCCRSRARASARIQRATYRLQHTTIKCAPQQGRRAAYLHAQNVLEYNSEYSQGARGSWPLDRMRLTSLRAACCALYAACCQRRMTAVRALWISRIACESLEVSSCTTIGRGIWSATFGAGWHGRDTTVSLVRQPIARV